jgi:hypothetical protein
MKMNLIEWRARWILTLVNAGIPVEQACKTFDCIYAHQEVDTSLDPIHEAQALIPAE